VITYTAWAHGTREEILAELQAAMTPGRSERRQAELKDAIEDLNAGAAMVKVRHTRYVVRGEAAKALDQIITVMDDIQV
jgi:hypothetical protein